MAPRIASIPWPLPAAPKSRRHANRPSAQMSLSGFLALGLLVLCLSVTSTPAATASSQESDPGPPSSLSDIDNLEFFVDTTAGLQIAKCASLDCFYAGEGAPLKEQYCDTDVFPDGCLRRWIDRSDFVPPRGFKPPEWTSGRDFGQDDTDKPGIVLDCLNGLPCVRGGRGAVQDRSLETEPKQVVGPIQGPFSMFLLARPTAQSDDFAYFGFAGTELTHDHRTDALKLRVDFRRPTALTAPGTVTPGQWHLIEIHRDRAHRVNVLVDGWDETLGSPSLPGKVFFRFLLSVSRGRAMHGDVASMAVFGDKLSSLDAQKVRSYLSETYSLPFGDGSPPPMDGAEIDLDKRLLLHWAMETACADGVEGPSRVALPACGKRAPQPIPGHLGQALKFDKDVHGLKSVPPHPPLDQLFRFTVAAWVQLPADAPVKTAYWRSVVDKRDSLEDGWDLYVTPDGRPFLRIDDLTLKGERPLEAGRWHHIAGVYDGSHMRVYLDGRLDRSRFVDHKVSLGTEGPLWVGRKFDDRSSPFVGAIDEVRVYGRALEAPEIMALANREP